MRLSEIREKISHPWFTTEFLRQLYPEVSPAYLALQLTRWSKAKKLHSLRRGLYAFPQEKASSAAIANLLVSPSYLSGVWALAYYGMIPEAVWEHTSACRISPRKQLWDTPLGRFSYRQVKLFRGFERHDIQGQPTLIACQEKALLDTWHWGEGEWTKARHLEMRYQQLDGLQIRRLERLVTQFDSPRIARALESFHGVMAHITDAEQRISCS